MIPVVARAHLASPRREGSLVVVDGTSPRFHGSDLWTDRARSPLTAAHQARLVVCDPFALPTEVRSAIEDTLRERRAPGLATALDVACVFIVGSAPAPANEEHTLVARFAQAFESPLTLPSLAMRSHDIEGLMREILAREGMRQKGHAVGLSDAALVLEHPFLGGDAALESACVRATNISRGEWSTPTTCGRRSAPPPNRSRD